MTDDIPEADEEWFRRAKLRLPPRRMSRFERRGALTAAAMVLIALFAIAFHILR